jgi:hypothetical protein
MKILDGGKVVRKTHFKKKFKLLSAYLRPFKKLKHEIPCHPSAFFPAPGLQRH